MASHIFHSSIDKFGRILLPKKLREQLGFASGSDIEVEEDDDKIILRAVRSKSRSKKKKGWPVFSVGHPVTQEMVNEVIRKTRR
ncbi:MAG: AbrB/MazE/SpoVT family DNA-binding domain-containing protein [Deltaproteobacteria bacterium]|nr:MAG: AbrB/MazE/SpoVT family DNA-binding domain-containing protein [Deltaproteobacteria bacterium]